MSVHQEDTFISGANIDSGDLVLERSANKGT